MLSSRPITIGTTFVLITAVALFLWIVVTAAADPSSPTQVPARGATPEPATPTLEAPRDSTLSAAVGRIRQEGAGSVLELSLAGDVTGLLNLMTWVQKPCDAPEIVWHRCTEAGVSAGTSVPVTRLTLSLSPNQYYDRTFVAAFLETLLGAKDASLVFAGGTSDRIGLSFGIPSPRGVPIGGGSPLQGLWFDIRRGPSPTIEQVYFFTQFSGPRQFFQTYYQPRGGELWYFDRQKAPAASPVPTPDAPPPTR
jgi:hypothetical protein